MITLKLPLCPRAISGHEKTRAYVMSWRVHEHDKMFSTAQITHNGLKMEDVTMSTSHVDDVVRRGPFVVFEETELVVIANPHERLLTLPFFPSLKGKRAVLTAWDFDGQSKWARIMARWQDGCGEIKTAPGLVNHRIKYGPWLHFRFVTTKLEMPNERPDILRAV